MKIETDDLIPLQNDETPPPPKKRARRSDAKANRQLILQTAQRLFAEKGLDNVAMMAIAEAAGVGQGTLYRAFANKGELCVALMDEDLQVFQEKTLILFRELSQETALVQLKQFLIQVIDFLDNHATLMCEAQNHQLLGEELSPTGLHTWFHQTVGLILNRAKAKGEISEEIDVIFATNAILSTLSPTIFVHYRQTLDLSIEKIQSDLWRWVVKGLAV